MKVPRLVADPQIAIVLGVASFLLGSAFLYDAFEGRGKRPPLPVRLLSWWR